MRRALLVLIIVLAAAPAASARRVAVGVEGGLTLNPYAAEVGKPKVFGWFVPFNRKNQGYLYTAVRRTNTIPMVSISTNDGYGTPEVLTPLGVARGGGDHYLIQMSRDLAALNRPVYIRLMAEMNQANNAYCAFTASGRSKGKAHSTRSFKLAWKRVTLIMRGGPVAPIDQQLQQMHLPPLKTNTDTLPVPGAKMLWVPQTRGTPDTKANSPQAYWPGAKWVDMVGTDFYSRFPRFDYLEAFYRAFASKPFVFGEWALWGADDVGFVNRFFSWVRTHKRVQLIVYNQGSSASSPFRLAHYPRARARIRQLLKRLP